ncbi:MAG: dipeptide ABC transporter ATP-binding protein [Sphingomonadales bacterium]|nr:dipeptide ABC transporter ATP-binding protein [Sphingomonadales bacterium]
MTTAPPLLEIKDLVVDFRAAEGLVRAVRGVSFDIPRGSTVALVGESGSGKTVLSQAILGILPRIAAISGGQMLFRDPRQPDQILDLAAYGEDHPVRRAIRGDRISIIFQEPMSSLSPLHTIGDQIGEALLLHAEVDRVTAKRRTIEMLDRVGFPKPERAYRTYPFELSGGLRQRAMIAMALVCDPALLIADEPTTALDVTIQAQTLQLMQELQKEFHMAILFITHDLGIVANMADEVVVLYRGRVMESGRSKDLLAAPRHPYLKALMHAVPTLSMAADQRLTPLREVRTSVRTLLGAGLEPTTEGERQALSSSTVLEVRGLRKTFRIRKGGWTARNVNEIVAVDDVGFRVRRGEAFGLVGESGCGKTTVSKLIMRAMRPDAGEIRFWDRPGKDGAAAEPIDILALDDAGLERFRRRLQYVFQDPFHSLNPRMTVYDIIAEPLVIHGIGDPRGRTERVKRLLQAVGLDIRHLRRYPHSFSGGQRQRIGIARALALGPELLICDEPVSALDVSVQAQILNLLKDLQDELGLTYLFISHNLAVVRHVSDQVGVMYLGRMVELADKADLFARFDKLAADAKSAAGAVNDEASFKAEWPKVAGNCGGCHKEYRKPPAKK